MNLLAIQHHFNGSKSALRREINDVVRKLEKHTPETLTGRGYRSGVLDSIRKSLWSGKKFSHPDSPTIGVDSISSGPETVGLSMQVSHTDGGKAQLLDFEVLFRDNLVKGCIFITQTLAEAEKRNFAANPDSSWGKTGNRIHFEYLIQQMDALQKFLKCPIAIIGVQSD